VIGGPVAKTLLLNSPHLLQKLSLSPVMLRLMQEAVKPEPDFSVMAVTIRLDPALATTILNLVNSAFYGLPQKVTDLNRAVSVLGSRELLKIAVAMSLQKDLENGFPDCEYDFFPDWRLIVWSAIAAELLAARLCPRQADQAYLCALLKDVSLLFLRCAAKELLADPDQRDHITVLDKDQLAYEVEHWGMHHGALSQMLLTRWGIPADMCESIRAHHSMDTLSEQSPLTQPVILATRWSEMELGHASGPFSVVQFEVLLRGVLGMSEREVDALRSECLEKFRSMLESLGIGEGDQKRAYYRHSVKVMQGYCFLSMDLLTAEGGLFSVARTLGKHIKLNWDVKSWDLALRTPHGSTYQLFHLTPEGVLEPAEGRAAEGRLPWRIKRPGLELTSSGTRLGELRLGEADLPQDELDNLTLYLRFFSQGFEYYCARQAVLEDKALAFDTIPIGVARIDGAGVVVEANTLIGEYLGLDATPRGQPLAEILARRFTGDTVAEVSAFLADADRASFGKIVYFLEQKQGGRAVDGCLYLSAHRSRDAQGQGVMLLLEDLRGLSEVEVQTLRRKNFLERLVGSMQELVLTVSAKGLVDFCSRQDLGLAGREFFQAFIPQQPHAGVWGPELFAADQPSPVETLLNTPGGSELPYELSIAPLTGKSGSAQEYLVVGRDLTQIRRLEAKLKVRALFDGLTGLFNHYQFHTTLEREVTRCRRTGRGLGMVFFDLDKFKAVNDTRGHLAGDAVLKDVGTMLLRQVRQGMDYPCRYGGDEFVVIVTEVDLEHLRVIGQRILSDVRGLFKGLVTISAGMSMLQEQDTPEALLKRVDNLAYTSKTAGGDTLSEG
jgi:diguanylate cyclase (GGDEF)-like protein